MPIYKKDGQPFDINAQHAMGGVTYPIGFFQDPDARAEHNITEEADQPAPAPTVAETIASITNQTQIRLDTFARTRGYDGILSACTYAASLTAKFAAEGQYCLQQRDATWAKLYAIMDAVNAGTRPMPTGYADVESDLPILVWPV